MCKVFYALISNNGATPLAPLTLGSDGMFYGTTKMGGSNFDGTLFEIDTNGTLNTLVEFVGTNGAFPSTALTLGNDGCLYGTAYYGGITNSQFPGGMGTVFKLTPDKAFSTIAYFNGTNGANPNSALVVGNDGNLLIRA
jgi:uncharacterized repeat protein (TIGR03803 family)